MTKKTKDFIQFVLVAGMLLHAASGRAQVCSLNLSGVVYDQYTSGPLEFANIFLEESGVGTTTDASGAFSLTGLCEGPVHVRITHLGCEPERLYFDLLSDTSIAVYLKHHKEFLEQVTVRSEHPEATSVEVRSSLTTRIIDKDAGKPLAQMLESIAGVSALTTGGGIAKPVVHGMYGNRLNFLNNGLIQAGQQWGNDHAPEIDPLAADRITVIKGVAALEYGSGNIGGVILVEPAPTTNDPHLHGNLNYAFQSNGRGHTLSGRMEQAAKGYFWRITGTIKGIGDHRAPDYYLTNTGSREANFSANLNTNWSSRWTTTLYYSLFNSQLGILRGAHISNLSDLSAAIGRDEPFFTEEDFSRQLQAPRQSVRHNLWKVQTDYLIDNQRSIRFVYGGQLNDRREYDIRRGGRSDQAALSLRMNSHQIQVSYTIVTNKQTRYKAGMQLRSDGNRNNPETGILPLLPDYSRYQAGAFLTLRQDNHPWVLEAGGRFDVTNFRVATISRTLPRSIVRYDHTFQNYSLTAGVTRTLSNNWTSRFNAALLSRSPEVNELHSFGLHQGVAGIEEGDPSLLPETSIKGLWTHQFGKAGRFLAEATAYAQFVHNYIFLEPQDEFRLTIRGAFPVFLYRQTDATLSGFDLQVKWEPYDKWELSAKYATVRGWDHKGDLPLVFMPADNISASASHFLKDGKLFSDTRIGLNSTHVFQQNRLEPDQDFLAPPPAFWLLGADIETRIFLKTSDLVLTLQAENILNLSYRSYLNRLRYYADDVGRNIRLIVRWGF